MYSSSVMHALLMMETISMFCDFHASYRCDGTGRRGVLRLKLEADIHARSPQLKARAMARIEGHGRTSDLAGHEPPGRGRSTAEGRQVAPEAVRLDFASNLRYHAVLPSSHCSRAHTSKFCDGRTPPLGVHIVIVSLFCYPIWSAIASFTKSAATLSERRRLRGLPMW